MIILFLIQNGIYKICCVWFHFYRCILNTFINVHNYNICYTIVSICLFYVFYLEPVIYQSPILPQYMEGQYEKLELFKKTKINLLKNLNISIVNTNLEIVYNFEYYSTYSNYINNETTL